MRRRSWFSGTNFTWDINVGLPVVLDDGNQYVYGAGLPSMTHGGNWYYYLADGLGSTMAIVDSSGNVENGYTHDVYGEPTVTGSLGNEFDFAGQQTDPSTGLQYLRARYYDPVTGTFMSREPLAAIATWMGNGFAYVEGSPVNALDPTGMWSIWPGGSGKLCLFGVGICEDGSPPPGVDRQCLEWNPYTPLSGQEDCADQLRAFDDWAGEQFADLAVLIGEYIAYTPDGPRKVTGFADKHAVNRTIARELRRCW